MTSRFAGEPTARASCSGVGCDPSRVVTHRAPAGRVRVIVNAPPAQPFSFEVDAEQRTLWLCGELDMASAGDLTRAAEPMAEQPGDIVVDLERLTFIDSSGLLSLLQTADHMREGNLVLRTPSAPVRRVLDLVDLVSVSRRIIITD